MITTSAQDIIREMGWSEPNAALVSEVTNILAKQYGMGEPYVKALIIAVARQIEAKAGK